MLEESDLMFNLLIVKIKEILADSFARKCPIIGLKV